MLNFDTNLKKKEKMDWWKIMVPFWQSLAVGVACWSMQGVDFFILFYFNITTDYKQPF